MKTTVEVDLKWFCFHQNNSGGYFNVNENEAHLVFIQARSAEEANGLAGDRFDHSYCSCCGERWNSVDEEEGSDEPKYYGKNISSIVSSFGIKEARLHYFDGRTETFVFPQK